MEGDDENAPPSMLYSILNPARDATFGSANIAAHVLDVDVMAGAPGKMTTLTVLLVTQPPGPVVPIGFPVPQAPARIYLALIEWHPGVVGTTGDEENAPPSMLYCVVNPDSV